MRRGRRFGFLAVVLVVVLMAPGSAAWAEGARTGGDVSADSVTNKDVPTDETGVVASPSSDEANSAAGQGVDTAADGANAPSAPASAPSSGDAGTATPQAPINEDVPTDDAGVVESAEEGEQDSGVEEGEGETAAPDAVAPALPDPVFGEGVNEDNLVNPQQKPDSSFIYDTAISDLQEADSYLNNQTVQVTGEVIGDRIRAEFDPGFCWIVLQGSDKAHSEIPVFLATDATEVIDTYGAYGRKGTMLQVRGTFHLICPEHEGLTDLHADTVTFVEKGSVTEQPFDIGAFLPGLMLVAIGFIMLIVFRQMREGQR